MTETKTEKNIEATISPAETKIAEVVSTPATDKIEAVATVAEVPATAATPVSAVASIPVSTPATAPIPAPARRNNSFSKKSFGSRKRTQFAKPRSEFDQKIIKIRRVTRVVSGGRRFSFSVAMVLGNRKDSVGVGLAKAADTALAIEKAVRNAKKNMLKLKLTSNNSIPYESSNKFCAAVVQIRPTQKGKGLSAGSATKTVLELAGITDVTAKLLSRSKNKLNIAKATVGALEEFKAESGK